jgi:hypothetical protein
MGGTSVAREASTVTVRVPIAIRKRGGRKIVLAPSGAEVTAAPVARHVDNAMVKAIARAFRWREVLESGTHATIAELAAAEEINESYVGRVLRLTLLAPDIVEAILGGRQPAGLQLDSLMKPFPVCWRDQWDALPANLRPCGGTDHSGSAGRCPPLGAKQKSCARSETYRF